MPRRPAEVIAKIPLFLIASAVKNGVKKAGEELERIVVRKINRHYYNISIHTRSFNRELRAGVQRMEVYAGTGVGA